MAWADLAVLRRGDAPPSFLEHALQALVKANRSDDGVGRRNDFSLAVQLVDDRTDRLGTDGKLLDFGLVELRFEQTQDAGAADNGRHR